MFHTEDLCEAAHATRIQHDRICYMDLGHNWRRRKTIGFDHFWYQPSSFWYPMSTLNPNSLVPSNPKVPELSWASSPQKWCLWLPWYPPDDGEESEEIRNSGSANLVHAKVKAARRGDVKSRRTNHLEFYEKINVTFRWHFWGGLNLAQNLWQLWPRSGRFLPCCYFVCPEGICHRTSPGRLIRLSPDCLRPGTCRCAAADLGGWWKIGPRGCAVLWWNPFVGDTGYNIESTYENLQWWLLVGGSTRIQKGICRFVWMCEFALKAAIVIRIQFAAIGWMRKSHQIPVIWGR